MAVYNIWRCELLCNILNTFADLVNLGLWILYQRIMAACNYWFSCGMRKGLKCIKEVTIVVSISLAINLSYVYVWVFVEVINGILVKLLTLSGWLVNRFKFVIFYDLTRVQNMLLSVFFVKHFEIFIQGIVTRRIRNSSITCWVRNVSVLFLI